MPSSTITSGDARCEQHNLYHSYGSLPQKKRAGGGHCRTTSLANTSDPVNDSAANTKPAST